MLYLQVEPEDQDEEDTDYVRLQVVALGDAECYLIHYTEPNEVHVTTYVSCDVARKDMKKKLDKTKWEDRSEYIDEYIGQDSFGAHAKDGFEYYELITNNVMASGGKVNHYSDNNVFIGHYGKKYLLVTAEGPSKGHLRSKEKSLSKQEALDFAKENKFDVVTDTVVEWDKKTIIDGDPVFDVPEPKKPTTSKEASAATAKKDPVQTLIDSLDKISKGITIKSNANDYGLIRQLMYRVRENKNEKQKVSEKTTGFKNGPINNISDPKTKAAVAACIKRYERQTK